MDTTNTIDPRAASLCASLDEALLAHPLRPEDIDETSTLIGPFEAEMARWPEPPQVPDQRSGSILRLLWWKSHPADADLAFIVTQLREPDPMLRLIAVDVMKTTLEEAPDRWIDSRLMASARDVVQYCAREESSPLLARQFVDVAGRFEQLTRPKRRPRPKQKINPYVAGPPVRGAKSFFGRDDILAQIRNLVLSKGSTRAAVLYGARRTGKTSLLYRIADGALGNGAKPVYVDLQGIAGSPLAAFLRTLIRSTWQALGSNPSYTPSSEPDFQELREFFDNALTQLGGESLVLMLDEYEVLQQYLDSAFSAQLMSLLEHWPNLFVIFSGSRKLEAIADEPFSRLLDLAKYMKITFLERSDAQRLVVEPAADSLRFAAGVVDRILTLTKGHPFYTQLLCQSIFDIASNTVTDEHVEEAVKRFMQNPAPHLVLSWNTLRTEQAAVGSTLAVLQESRADTGVEPAAIVRRLADERFPIPLSTGGVQRALTSLSLIDWVEKRREVNEYRFSMELVRRWVAEERPVAMLAAKQEQEMAAKAAGYWRQRRAWLVDFLIAGGGLLALGAVLHPRMFAFLVPFVYFVVTLGLGDATAGMKALRLQVAAAPGNVMDKRRRFWLMLLYTAQIFVEMLIITFLYLSLDGPIAIPWLMVCVAIEVLDNVMVALGRKRQGLWNRMAGTMVIPSEVFEL